MSILFIVTLLGFSTFAGADEAESAPRPVICNVRDFGAVGDGVTNDTLAFYAASQAIQNAGGGTLVIPKAVYIVGLQTHGTTPDHPYARYRNTPHPYYKEHPIITFNDLDGITIEGNGATLRVAAGLRFGAFNAITGEPVTDTPDPNVFDRTLTAAVGCLIDINRSRNVVIRNLQLDGNNENLRIGGTWSRDGRQIVAYGLRLFDNHNVRIENIHTHHHALDGIAIGYTHLTADDPPTPHTLVNVNSEYNCRQAFSWVGGRGITAINCKFNHTGRAAFATSPGAGLDIEAEDSVCRDGLFVNCQFINNTGCALAADSGDGGYTRFVNCTIRGTTSWSVWANKPAMTFEDCHIQGSMVHGFGSDDPNLATQYRRCTIDDADPDGLGCYRNTALINHSGENVLFEDCTITAMKTKACYIDYPNREIFRRCIITHGFADAPDRTFQSIFRGSHLENVTFKESFTAAAADKTFSIEAQGITVGEGVHVDGPQAKWANWSWGTTGDITPAP